MEQEIYFNPITELISNSIENAENELTIAVPFITKFAKSILTKKRLDKFKKIRLLTCFNEFNLNSFDLDTLKYFLQNGVELRFNNEIHLKLYLFDEMGFMSSSNLTKSGFENSIEMTSSINKKSIPKCKAFFNQLWHSSENRIITNKLIEENYSKYLLLKKRATYKKPNPLFEETNKLKISNWNLEDLIDFLFKAEQDFSYFTKHAFEANKDRVIIKERLKKGFNINDFYIAKGGKNREGTVYYRMMYGGEGFIAGTGLRESQFKQVFENEKFSEIISYIYPPIIGKEDWNLEDPEIFREYCRGLFEFKIPQYVETLPIRLASYFYPQNFLPIFKLDQLEKACKILGLNSNANGKGDRLFAFNSFLLEKMRPIPYDNYIKSSIMYQLYFTVELLEGLEVGKSYEEILKIHKESWKKDYIQKGKEILRNLNSVSDKL